MPVIRCQLDGRRGYKWGEGGRCYTYRTGDRRGKARARLLAEIQGRAIEASKARRG